MKSKKNKKKKKIGNEKKSLNSKNSIISCRKGAEMKKRKREKVVKINGVKTVVILPQSIDPKEFPKELKSKPNHPAGLVTKIKGKLFL